MERIAQCCCGTLRAKVWGEPAAVAACHCKECQRRTGSAFAAIAFFPAEAVEIEGVSRVFAREGQKGRMLIFHFCPRCGSSVFWEAEFRPGEFGIAVGAFADPDFPRPVGLGLGAVEASLGRLRLRSPSP
ncbi:GFA family protein [Chelativorans sp. AA-79]|uniref:GFA family protein n=1 Tax=Chelativorans sp. AA-79 TaxID=3028735 RepID=UPI0023F8B8B5|nr:GFA family protein [Chelativorans sp. AA-79]WEX08657.1 GFA family protein [Chelativorans sp. AA-79]